MMLYKLSLSNMKKSIKDYTIYFFTLILGVCIFYIFNSLDSQTAMLNVSAATGSIIELIKTVISVVSIFVSFVLGFLIIYASRFLIKKRNKEFGIYMTLGMSKRKISKMLLIETLLIGVISLGIGLVLGIVLSQLTSIFIANLFSADMTSFTFNFSVSATIKTLIYFGIIYFIVMLFNTIIISKCKLIDLLQSSKKSEKVKLKNSVVCIIVFIIAVGLLVTAYYMVTEGFYDIFANKEISFLLVPMSMGIVGTVLFFWSLSGMFLKVISRWKSVYYKGLNTFIYKELSSQINTMVVAMSVICIMIFLTICLLASALSIKDYFNNSLEKNAPADVEVAIDNNGNTIDVEQLYKDEGIYDELSQLEIVDMYEDETFDYKASLGSYYNTLKEKYPYVRYDAKVYITSLTEYNELARIMKSAPISLNEGEYRIVSNYEKNIYENVLALDTKINIYGNELKSASKDVVEGDYWCNANGGNVGFFVVPDSVIKNKSHKLKLVIANYKTEEKAKQIELNNKIEHLDYKNAFSYTDKIVIKDNSVGISAMSTFIGIYLGIIFLISSAAILSLKVLADTIDARRKYKILRNIGTDEKDINKSLFKQILIFFLLPLALASVHTIFGIKFCLLILESVGIKNIAEPILITCGLILLIYGGYFLITYSCSKKIIKEKR